MANKCSGASAVVSLAILAVLCVTCVSSEIVGGHVYWKQIINKKVKLIYRLQWEGGSEKHDYTGKGTKRREGDIYICDVKTSKAIKVLKFQNLAYNPYRKWTIGQGATKVSLKAKAFEFYLAEMCKSPFLRLKEPQTSKWSIYISGNLTSPSGNKSPVSYMNPVVPFRPSCYRNIKIPIHDNDHELQCRWPSVQHGECVPSQDMFSNVLPSCDLPRGASLKNCKLMFDGTNTGTHVLTVMIEARQDGHLQSKVPVQFTVEIIPTKKSDCALQPSFDVDERSCIYNVHSRKEFTEETFMEAVRGESIIEIESIMPTGMELAKRNTIDGFDRQVYELAFRWPAKYVTRGTHLVCFVVTRSDGFMSRQQCFEVNVYSGDVTNATVAIVSPTKENNFKMRMTFNYEVKLPSVKGEIMVVIGETHKNQIESTLPQMMSLIFTENYKGLKKEPFTFYDLAKQTTPVSVNVEDKHSFTLDLQSLLGKGVISKKTRFIVVLNFKDPTSLVKYLPCRNISELDQFITVCVFDGKSTSCTPPY